MRRCRICNTPGQPEVVARWAGEGMADREIARRLNIPKSSVNRHRLWHIVQVERNRLAILEGGAPARRERAELAAAAASPHPSPEQQVAALFGIKALSERLRAVEARLERSAQRAENDGAYTGVAALSGQQLRGVEVGAKLAGVGGYAPRREGEGAAATSFHLTINVPGKKPLVIDAAVPEVPPEADAEGE